MPTVFADSTVRIFTILSIGTVGIMIHIYTIHFIIPHGIRRITVGAGEAAGILLTLVGAGVIHPITVIGTTHITEDFMVDITEDTLIITAGMVPEITGMPIRKTTVTDKEGQPEQTCFAVATAEEGLQLQKCVHPTVQLKVPATVQPQGLQITVAGQLRVQV